MAGVDVEVLLFLTNTLNFTADLVRADNFGIPKMNGWTGIMGQLVTGLSEFSISQLSMTTARASKYKNLQAATVLHCSIYYKGQKFKKHARVKQEKSKLWISSHYFARQWVTCKMF